MIRYRDSYKFTLNNLTYSNLKTLCLANNLNYVTLIKRFHRLSKQTEIGKIQKFENEDLKITIIFEVVKKTNAKYIN